MLEKLQTPKPLQVQACKHKQGDIWEPGCCGDDAVQASQNRVSDSSKKSTKDKLLPQPAVQISEEGGVIAEFIYSRRAIGD